jgi:hypothetical protein
LASGGDWSTNELLFEYRVSIGHGAKAAHFGGEDALAFKDGRNVLEKGYGFRDLESYIPKPTHAASVSPQPA